MVQTQTDTARTAAHLKATVLRHDRRGEIGIAKALGAISITVIVLHLIAAVKTDWQSFNIWVVGLLLGALAICAARMHLAKRRVFSEVMLGTLTLCEVGVFISLIWSYQFAHNHSAAGVLKSPSVVFLFVLIGVRALRFHPLPAIMAGAAVSIGWAILAISVGILEANSVGQGSGAYVAYVSGDSMLLGAEVEKLFGFAGLTAVIALAVSRGRTVIETTAQIQAQQIEALTQARQEAEGFLERAQAADRAKSNFLANMSHELRTPLNAIQGFSDLMRHEINGPIQPTAYRQYVDDIHDSGTHLLKIVDDILEVSSVSSETTAPDETTFDFGALANEAVAAAIEQSPLRENDIQIDLGSPIGDLIANRRHVHQVLANLIGNALKFSKAGDPVRVSWDTVEGGLTIKVRDSGIGISQDDLQMIGQPFQQVESTYVRSFGGVGLGLSIVRRIVEDHGGTLELDSTVGDGTTATVQFSKSRWSPPVEIDGAPIIAQQAG